MSKKILAVICVLLVQVLFSTSFSFENVAYVETNDNALKNMACFVDSKTGKAFFDTAVIFAANINGTNPNKPEIYLNNKDSTLLNKSDEVGYLHSKNIKVVVALLGNHQAAGWSTVTNYADARLFAKTIADFVNKYQLDGIAIDDEYSTGAQNENSMLMIVKALRSLPEYKGKTISKVILSGDKGQFSAGYAGAKLADFLDYATPGYYPGAAVSLLPPYLQYGMSKHQLYVAVSTSLTSKIDAVNAASQAITGGWGGLMVFNVAVDSYDYLNALYLAEYKDRELKNIC
ncbi:glycosyl hydrolase family 18 protein [Piscirickettsia salmonis]|uniref:glycosyl hydrolase family 18 protein n=1 Tax=Piscirickettsia salmonis TaxID=1238 RepID=UPI0007C8AB14|nr:Endo-beta-N-acetylglucosaminidase H precursor [Piscirickettsiaceae bacterium NZ-RLO1]